MKAVEVDAIGSSEESGPREVGAKRRQARPLADLDLPTDRPRPLRPGNRCETVLRHLAGAAADASPVQALAAFATLLHRTSGESRFPLDADLGDGATRRLAVEAGPRRSFGELVEELARRGDGVAKAGAEAEAGEGSDGAPPTRAAFFVAADGVGGNGHQDPQCCAGRDLALTWQRTGDGLRAVLAYDPDLFDATTAERHLARFETVLTATRGDGGATLRLAELPYLTAQEHRLLVAEWNDTGDAGQAAAGVEPRLEARVAAQARSTPDATAVIHGDGRWSYRRLDAAAAAVERRLAAAGLGAGDRVGLYLPRTPALLAALLGVLRRGAVYVPLDPEYPAERVAFMLADCAAGAVLTDDGHRAALPATDAAVLVLAADPADEADDADEEKTETGAGTDARDRGGADAFAYLIYTSGSTGRPKGVAIRQRSACAMLDWARATFGAEERAAVLAATSVCFDLSVFEIFLPLTTGGAVVLARDALQLPKLAAGGEVTMINSVPSAVTELLHGGGLPASVRTVNLAGEPLQRDLVERLYALPHVERVYNLYGPSEDTTYSTWERVPAGAGLPVTIGRPVSGTRAHVVDTGLRLAGVGIVGELALAGAGLAVGYLGRAAATAAAFVPDPFVGAGPGGAVAGGEPGDRLYLTGDLVRRRPDGRLDFLGRRDHQVKVRGFRIELGEIEAALVSHRAVREAVVVVRRDVPQDPRITAYWVAADNGVEDGTEDDVRELRRHLEARLPAYMVPNLWLRLPALPLTPNGKVDRRALPAPGPRRPASAVPYRAPAGETEEALAALWRELLAVDDVGADDDLFELGGHSLLAARLLARVRQDLAVELPPEAPFLDRTVADLARRIDELRDSGEGTATAVPQPPPPRRYERRGPIPLAFPQEQIWVVNQLKPDNLAYNFQYTVRFRGPLRRRLLEATLSEIVRRHEVLRTTFPALDGEPAQVVHPPWPARLPLVDLSGLPADLRGAEEARLVHRVVRRRFDVTELPLLAWTLLRLAPREHLFCQVEQHFIHDGWSIGRILSEIQDVYAAYAAGRPSPLPELPVQYADFALWQRDWMQGEALQHQLGYWRRQLADIPAPLDLPTDRPRTRSQEFRGRRLDVDVPPPLYAALQEAGRNRGFTLFMLMTAAFEVLLHRYTGRRDYLLGSGVANRRFTEFEPLIGMVVNTLVLRADLSGKPTLAAVVERVRGAALGLQAHQDLPFEKLVAELQPQRDLSRNPLFQHMFSFHDAWVPDLVFADLEGELVERHNGSAKADFNVIVKPRASQRQGRAPSDEDRLLRVLWEYSTDLFDDATVERMWHHYLVLLRAVVETPQARIDLLPLLTAAERTQLATWDGSAAPAPPFADDVAIPQQVAAAAAAHPHSPAVVDADGHELTYGELWQRSGRLARRLADLGVGAETVVGVCLPPSADLVVALVAVLRSGAAYLPLDPTHPAERLAYSLADSACPVLLTAGSEAAGDDTAFAAFDGLRLAVDAVLDEDTPGDDKPAPPAAEQLAYVIYTSGTTGRPKGTGLTHRGLAGLVAWHRREYAVTADDRATLVASPAFDASVWELWPYLTAGAAVCVPPPALRTDPPALYRWLARSRISLCFLPTPLAEVLLQEEPPPELALRALLVGGDRLHRPPRRALPCRLMNHYGPTEDTVVTTWGEADPETVPPAIGRPVRGHRVHLLDGALQPVPQGVPAALWVGGAGLARGYPGRPALTADRFRPDPFSPRAGERLYRTGDLARWLRDGRLDFLGRDDDQVKIRGFRIELGEIESLLADHPAVRAAAVVVAAAAERLVAFIVPAEEVPADGADDAALGDELANLLTDDLAAKLPAYMVPSTFVAVDELPLSPTGKVDRGALERRAADTAPAAAGGGPPRTDSERRVAAIWAEVLGLDVADLGCDADFFALGGHSLAAIKAVGRVAEAVGAEVTPSDLFEHSTVAAFAAAADRRRGSGGGAAAPIPRTERVAGRDRHAGFPLSFAQERLWLMDRLIPLPSTYHVARAYRLRGTLHVAALGAALADLVERHEVLRTTLEAGDEPLQRVAPPDSATAAAAAALPRADLADLPPAAAEKAAEEALRRAVETPFDLAAEPPLRALLLRHGSAEHTLLLVLHHVAADGWSLPLLYRDLELFYRARRDGLASPLDELPVQYADFAVWQRDRLGEERLRELTDFWQRRLAGAPPVLELPTDRRRPALRSMRGERLQHRVPAASVAALRRVAADAGATLFQALLAAWAALLSRWSGQLRVVVGTPVAGRGHGDLERLVGFFVNTLPIAVDLADAPGFAALTARVKETVQAALAHQDLPFERLVDLLAPQRDLAHSPLFQITLAYSDTPEEMLHLHGLDVSPRPVARREAHYELTLFANAAEDGGLELAFTLERDLFDAATVQRMGDHLERLLAAAGAEPQRPVDRLPILSAAEHEQVTRHWSRGGDVSPAALAETQGVATLPQAVAAVARRFPDAEAVVADGVEPITYGELQRRADRLARCLRRRGVTAETRVGVALERSAERIIVLLAVLRAGGAYVPVDPEYPASRRDLMLRDAGAGLLLVDGDADDGDAESAGPSLLHLRTLLAAAEREDGDAAWADAPLGADRLAYVVYTSGSTGRPKGVMVSHRSVLRVAWGQIYTPGFAPGTTCLHFAPLAFDASVLEIWGPLLNGGRVAVMAPGPASPDDLADHRRRHGVTTAWLTAGLFNQMVEARPDALGLDWLLTGGEAMSPPHALRLRAEHPDTHLLNGYGPTENTVFTTVHALDGGEATDRPVPIGRPLAGTTAYVLDRHLRPLPPGVYGELCSGGDGLARGYLGRPARTAEVFVPHPFSTATDGAPGARLYRTGDLARWLPAGRLDFLGRRDGQIKLRGFRIEQGEVEAALAAAPRVAECAVVLRRDDADDPRLVAYVVADGDGAPAAELRAFLADRLPGFMVPSDFVCLDALPLTANGKLDRGALPAPQRRRDAAGTAYVAPRSDTEERLTAIWAEVLGLKRVGVEDDFFALGGHSLRATQAISRVRESFGVDLPLRTIFQAPAVAEFAGELAAALGAAEGAAEGTGDDSRSAAAAAPGPIARADRGAHRRRRSSVGNGEDAPPGSADGD